MTKSPSVCAQEGPPRVCIMGESRRRKFGRDASKRAAIVPQREVHFFKRGKFNKACPPFCRPPYRGCPQKMAAHNVCPLWSPERPVGAPKEKLLGGFPKPPSVDESPLRHKKGTKSGNRLPPFGKRPIEGGKSPVGTTWKRTHLK